MPRASRVARNSALQDVGPPARVILITVAGLESADYLNLWGHVAIEGDDVRMPNLARLAREGALGVAAHPPAPGSIYASHATLATGRRPTQHGVIADQALDEAGERSLPFWDSRLLKGGALWDAAIGRGVLALGWPTTAGARIELVVPDGIPTDSSKSWLNLIKPRTTPSLHRKLQAMAASSRALAARSVGPENGDIGSQWPTPIEKDSAFIDLACGVAQSERDPGLTLIRLSQTAAYQRAAGFGTIEVDEALVRIDSEIGRLLQCLTTAGRLADTAIFVTGDVRYQAVHTRVNPNVALVRNGLIGRDPRTSLGVRSWLAISRSNGRSAYVYAREASDALRAREVLEVEAARTGAFEVVSAERLSRADADPQAWFGIAAMPGFVIGNGLARPILRPSDERASEGEFPFRDVAGSSVGFVAWGRGIRSRVRIPSLDLADVAPTIATLLGLRFDQPVAGKSLVGILRATATAPPPGPKRLGVDNDGDVDRALRELGGGRELGRDE